MINIFKKINNFLLDRMYKSCLEELTFNRRFYVVHVRSEKGKFKEFPLEFRVELFEKEIITHIAEDVFPIYYKKFKDEFRGHLKMDAFGYLDIQNKDVARMFEESCKNAERN